MVTVFLSYAHEDQAFVNRLSADLRSIGYQTVQYTSDFTAGNVIKSTIKNRIERANVFIPVLSDNALRSKWVCKVELPLAKRLQSRGGALRIIPVFLSGNVAQVEQLRNINQIDFTDAEGYALGLARLVAALPHAEYDELFQLRKDLNELDIENQTMLALLKKAAKQRGSWDNCTAADVINAMDPYVGDYGWLGSAYWHLILYGVLRLIDINRGWTSGSYAASMKFAEIAPRGVVLLNELITEP
jgi:hypothetical protein